MQVPFKRQMRVEVVDKTHLCRTRVALVEQVSHAATVELKSQWTCVVSVRVLVSGDRRPSPSGLRGV